MAKKKKITVTDKQTGQRATVYWNSPEPPTEQDFESILQNQRETSKKAVEAVANKPLELSPTEKFASGMGSSKIGPAILDFGKGVLEGAGLPTRSEDYHLPNWGEVKDYFKSYTNPISLGDVGHAIVDPFVQPFKTAAQGDVARSLGQVIVPYGGLAAGMRGALVKEPTPPMKVKDPGLFPSEAKPPAGSTIIDAEYSEVPKAGFIGPVEQPPTMPPAGMPQGNPQARIAAPPVKPPVIQPQLEAPGVKDLVVRPPVQQSGGFTPPAQLEKPPIQMGPVKPPIVTDPPIMKSLPGQFEPQGWPKPPVSKSQKLMNEMKESDLRQIVRDEIKKDAGEGTNPVLDAINKKFQETGAPVSLPQLRAEFPNLSPEEFNSAVLKGADDRRLYLTTHDHGPALPEGERNLLVADEGTKDYHGRPSYYSSAMPREDYTPVKVDLFGEDKPFDSPVIRNKGERGAVGNLDPLDDNPDLPKTQRVHIGRRGVVHAQHGRFRSTDQFLELNPAAKPVVDLIRSAFYKREGWRAINFDKYLSSVDDSGVGPAQQSLSWKARLDEVHKELPQGTGYVEEYFPRIMKEGKEPSGIEEVPLEGEYGSQIEIAHRGVPESPFLKERTRESIPEHLLETNPKIVYRKYIDSVSREIFDKPAIQAARQFVSGIADPVDRFFANWYIDRYAGVGNNPIERLLRIPDRKITRMGARSYLAGSTKLQLLHGARVILQTFPEQGVANTAVGLVKTLADPIATRAKLRSSGLINPVPHQFKTGVEKFDNIMNYADIGNSFAKGVSLNAAERRLKLSGDPNWQRNAVYEAARTEGYTNPTSPIYFLEEQSRYFLQFKYWLFKLGENVATRNIIGVMNGDKSSWMRMGKYLLAGAALHELSQKTNLSLFHVRGSNLLTMGSAAKSEVEALGRDLAAGKFDQAAIRIAQYVIPGGHSVVQKDPRTKKLKVVLPKPVEDKARGIFEPAR